MQVVPLAVMYGLVRAVDFSNEDNVLYLRMTYLLAQGLCWACMLYIYHVVTSKNNMTKVQVMEQSMFSADPAAEAKKEPVEMTVRDYHLQHLKQMMLRILVSTGVIALLHLRWAFMPPLLMQCILNPQQIYNSQVFALHVMNKNEANYPLPWEQNKQMDFAKMFENSTTEGRQNKIVCQLSLFSPVHAVLANQSVTVLCCAFSAGIGAINS